MKAVLAVERKKDNMGKTSIPSQLAVRPVIAEVDKIFYL
jgi:hypothetical protein